MALITCPECGQNISNMADKCPHCGLPQSQFNSQTTVMQPKPQYQGGVQSHPQYPYQQPANTFGNHSEGMDVKPVKPENYMSLAIISLIIGGLLFGIVSIVYSSKVDALYANGCYTEAISASNNAKIWSIVGIALGVLSIGFTIFALMNI